MASEHEDPVRRRQTDELIAAAHRVGVIDEVLAALVDELTQEHWLHVRWVVLEIERRRGTNLLRDVLAVPVADAAD